MQAVKDKLEVGARQQLLEAVKVKDLLEEAQVVLHRVNDLQKTMYQQNGSLVAPC